MIKKLLIAFSLLFILQGCSSSDEDYDYGYGDGYGAGYNTTCNIRSTMIKADWDNKNYSSGYRDGYADGARACKRTQ